jgi:hypothetical protein
MLELRPNCELCDADLPPESTTARICSYECTYCAPCVDARLHNVCPTCGGGFQQRPVRPVQSWRPDLALGLRNHPAATVRKHSNWTTADLEAFVGRLRSLPPEQR